MSCAGAAAVLKNLLRGAALAMAATFLGCFLVYTLPDWAAAQLNRTMPYWFYEREVRGRRSCISGAGRRHACMQMGHRAFRRLPQKSVPDSFFMCMAPMLIMVLLCWAVVGISVGLRVFAVACLQQAILALGTALANWVMSSFYR